MPPELSCTASDRRSHVPVDELNTTSVFFPVFFTRKQYSNKH